MSAHCGCDFVLPRAKNVDNDRSDLEKPLQRHSGGHLVDSVPERTMRRIVIDEHHHQLSLLSAAVVLISLVQLPVYWDRP